MVALRTNMSADEKPIVYILHGDDPLAIRKFISGMEARMGEASIADLNTSRLDGRTATDNDLRNATLSIPFLSERRIVIVTNPLARFSERGRYEEDEEETEESEQTGKAASRSQGGSSSAGAASARKAARERYLALLDSLPPSTALVLVVPDERVRRKGQWAWETLTDTHWLSKWAYQAGPRVLVKEYTLPAKEEMPQWIRRQAEAQGGQFSPLAARALADHLGNDTEVVAQEITKLLTYANFKRPVEEDDVQMLTIQTNQASIFDFTDAIGEGNSRRGLQVLHQLLEVTEPPILFGMIVRQFRQLLLAREILDEGGNQNQITQELKIHPYVGSKLEGQARRFTLAVLQAIYRQLLAMDEAMKTSQMAPEVAFDTFIAELTITGRLERP